MTERSRRDPSDGTPHPRQFRERRHGSTPRSASRRSRSVSEWPTTRRHLIESNSLVGSGRAQRSDVRWVTMGSTVLRSSSRALRRTSSSPDVIRRNLFRRFRSVRTQPCRSHFGSQCARRRHRSHRSRGRSRTRRGALGSRNSERGIDHPTRSRCRSPVRRRSARAARSWRVRRG